MKKRLTALILILTMLWSSGLDVVPGLFSAYAEEDQIENTEETEVPVSSSEVETAPAAEADPAAPAENTEQNVPPTEEVPAVPAESTEQVAPPAEAVPAVPVENTEQAALPAEVIPAVPAENTEQAAPPVEAAPAAPVAQAAPVENSEQVAPPVEAAPAASVAQAAPAGNTEHATQSVEAAPVAPAENTEQTVQFAEATPATPAENTEQVDSATEAASNQEAPAQDESNSEFAGQNPQPQGDANQPMKQGEGSELQAVQDEVYEPALSQDDTSETAAQQGEINQELNNESGTSQEAAAQEENIEPASQQEQPGSDFLFPVTPEEETNGEADNQEEDNQTDSYQENGTESAPQQEQPGSDFLYPVTPEEGISGGKDNQEEDNQTDSYQEDSTEPAPQQEQPGSDFLYPVTPEEGTSGEADNQEELNQEENSEPVDADAQQGTEIQETEKQPAENQSEENNASPALVEETKASRTIQTQVGDRIITVTGNIPEGAVIQAAEIPQDTARKITGRDADYAYDVRLMVNGEVWQPEEYGEEVQVTIEDLNGNVPEQKSEIIHVKADLMDEEGKLSQEAIDAVMHETMSRMVETETLETESEDGKTLSFETSSFSPMVNTPSPTVNLLQKLFENAISQRTEKELKEKIQIKLEKNTTYGSADDITVFEVDNTKHEVKDGFLVEVIAEDAGDDGMQADGSTVYLGSLTILGIPVVIKGVTMPGNVRVWGSQGSLDLYGTRADDGLNLTVEMGAQATVRTGEGADTVTAKVEDTGSSLNLDTGAGTDTVSAKVSRGVSAEIETGEGEDTVTLSMIGNNNSTQISTGEGADTVTATADGENSLTILTGDDPDMIRAEILDGSVGTIISGEGDDTVDVSMTRNSRAKIETGRGDDTIGLTGISQETGKTGTFVSVNAGEGNDTVIVAGKNDKAEKTLNRGSIEIGLGKGDNEIRVDLSIADFAQRVDVKGGEDNDRLHVTGTLKQLTDGATSNNAGLLDSSTQAQKTIQLDSITGKTLNISRSDIDVITDNLVNKRREEIDLSDQTGTVSNQAISKAFTDYVFTGYSDQISALNILKAAEGADDDLIMTNVIIAPDDNNAINVKQNTAITAEGLQLVLLGKTVQVDGTVKAGLVRIEAVDGTDTGKTVHLNDQVPMTDIDIDSTFSLQLLNISNVAKVTIGENARVYSEGDILITSAVEQNGGIINIGDLSQINLVDLKVARATVDVQGKLYAGYNLKTETSTNKRGSVNIATSAKTTTGFDEDGDPVNGLPIAIALANMDSVITIAKDAEIHATDSIRLVSNADLRLASRADSYASLPVAVAAVYATVDSRVDVEGTLDAKQDINVTARGNTEVTTIADTGDQESISGAYVGLAVVLQNVKAELGISAKATAGRDVNVKSFAREKVDTLATTQSVDGKSGEQTVIGETYDAATDLFKQAYETLMSGWDKIKSMFTGADSTASEEEQEAAEELDNAIRKVSVSDHGIAVDEHAKAKGDVSIKTETADQKVTNTVTVTPKAGYKVKSITWRGLDPGDTAYTYGEPLVIAEPDTEPKSISFTQSTKQVTIFVEYEEEETEEDEAEEDEDEEDEEDEEPEDGAELFEDGTTNNNIVVDDFLGKVTAAATDDIDDEEVWDVPWEYRDISLSLPIVKAEDGETVQGAVLTYATEENGACLGHVASGQALRLVVNPAKGKLLKAGSLKVKYRHDDITEIKIITADDHGRYIVYLPDNLQNDDGGVVISAEFVDETEKDIAEPQRGTQIAGAAAITITENNNTAVINAKTEEQQTAPENGEDGAGEESQTVEVITGAQVTAGRDVNVTAESVADIRNAADGTAVTQTVATGTRPEDPEEEQSAAKALGQIPLEIAKIGKVTIFSDHESVDPGEEVKVTVKHNDKEQIKAGTLKAVLTTKDGTYREEIYLFRQSDYTFTFRMPDQLPGDVKVSDLKVTFTGETAEGATGAGVSTSLGAAVALTVSSSHNRADIKGAVEAAQNITVRADGDGAARTETRAGYSEGTMGIGGAVSAQVAAMDSRARIHKTAAVALDGDLILKADNNVQYYADADGSGSKRNAKNMGIGAGLAVAFDGAHAVAAIEDGAAITGKSGVAIGSLTLRANQTVDDLVQAAAGAGSSGTSLMAALALDIVTTSAKARLGNVTGGTLHVKGETLITADNAAKHDLMSEGAVAGKGTGVGAALSGSLVTDKAVATLGGTLNGDGGVAVDAVNESAVRNVNIASASGGRNPFRLKVQDDIWLKLITGVVWLYSLDNTLNKDVANVWIKYHLPNIMTSSTMGVAGAGGLNIQTSVAKAEIAQGTDVTTGGKLAVNAQNRTEALVKGDASTTNSTMGIGVGAGVNFVKMNNIAFIGNGRITAASLEVTATTKEKELSFEDAEYSYAVDTEVNKKNEAKARDLMEESISQSVDDYVNDLVREIGLDDLLPGNIMDSVISPVIDSATEELLGLGGLGEMFSDGIIQQAADFFGDTWDTSKWILVGLISTALEFNVINVEDLLNAEHAQDVIDDFKKEFNTTLLVSVRDNVVQALKQCISGIFNKIFHKKDLSMSIFTDIITDTYGDVETFIKIQLKPALKRLDRAWLKDLAKLCGNEYLTESEAEEIIDLAQSKKKPKELSPYMEAAVTFLHIEGEEWERYKDQALVLDEYAKKFIEYNKQFEKEDDEAETPENETGLMITLDGERYTLGDAIIKKAEEQNVMLTDDQKAVLRNPYDLMAEEQKASAGTHLIDTQGISGAGAAGTSVSGAAAVTKLDFTTKAQVGYDKLSETEPDKEKDYTVHLEDYIDKVTKPKSNASDSIWADFMTDIKYTMTLFVVLQKQQNQKYKDDLAAYKKEKKKKEKENKEKYPEIDGDSGKINAPGQNVGSANANIGKQDNQGQSAGSANKDNQEKEEELKKPKEEDYKLTRKDLNNLLYLYHIEPPYAEFDDPDWYEDFMDDLIKEANKYIEKQDKLDKKYDKDFKEYTKAHDLNVEHLGKQINVAGDVLINADNSRLVNNTASASLNGKGNASANGSAADAANSDVGDSSSARKVTEGKNVHMTTDVGIQTSIEEKEQDKNRPKIRITVKDGFELEQAEDGKYYANYSYGDEGDGNEGGTEKEGKIEIKRDANGLYINTDEVPDDDADQKLYFTLGTMEVLRKIKIANPIANGVNVQAGAVTAQVKGRDLDEDDELSARAGDTVVVTVQKKDGMLPDYIKYSYKDKNGQKHTVEINPTVVTGRDLNSYAFTSVTKSGDEYILNFRMPDADENGVTIETQFSEYEEDPSWMPNTSFKIGIGYALLGASVSGLGRGMGIGASFTMLTGSDDTTAMIGDRQKGDDGKEDAEITGITAGKLTVIANSDHRETLSSVAGTDPLSGDSTAGTLSAMSLDASVAVNMLDNSVRADVDKVSKTSVTGYSSGSVSSKGDVKMTAADHSETSLNASAFSAGRGTAVGASVVVNTSTNDATVDVGEINAEGSVTLKAESQSNDTATAVASAVGADVIRILRVAGVDLDDETDSDEIADKTDEVASGKTDSAGDDPDTPTQSINKRLNENRSKNQDEDDADEGEKTSDSMSLSSNVLRSQGVTTDVPDKEKSDMETTVDGVNLLAQIGLTGLSTYTHFKNLFTGKKFQISASVASTQATHTANVNIHGNVRAESDISATADNTADFAALATAASMSLLPKATAVSGGVSIVDNKNEANVKVEGNLISQTIGKDGKKTAAGDINLKSTLIQNLGEDSVRNLTAMSVSGSVAGYDSLAAIGAAISVVKSKAKTTVSVSDGKEDKERRIYGKNIDIEAIDQSRLAARAGGVSISMGSSFGIGLGASKIKSSNTVAATIGEHTDITGASFTLNAEKKEVTEKDYKNLLDMRNSDSDPVSFSQKDKEGKENNVRVNLYADKILDLYDGINKYSFQNNYVEAIGATAGLTSGKLSVGGAFAIVQTKNDVRATMGNDVYMELESAGKEGSGNVKVTATDRATNRMIAGGLSISPSSANVGAAITLMQNKDTAVAKIGKQGFVKTDGDITLAAEVGGTSQAFTAAMSMAISVKREKKIKEKEKKKDKDKKTEGDKTPDTTDAGKEKTKTVGGSIAMAGAVNYIINTATATAETGSNTSLKGGGKTSLTSKADSDMMALAADSTISIGWKAPAVGAAGNIIHDQTGAYTTIGKSNTITGQKIQIGSDTTSQLISGVASQSAAMTGSGTALAAAVNYNYAAATAKTHFDKDDKKATKITATAGDADIYAKADAWALTAAVALPGGVDTTLGGSVNINLFDRTAKADMDNMNISAGKGNVRIQSSGKDTSYIVGILMEGSVKGKAGGGNINYSTEDNSIVTDLGGNTKVTAGKNVLIESYFDDKTAAAAGSIILANVGTAVGATGLVLLKQNTVETLLGASEITAKNGSGSTIKNLSGDKVDGIYVGANAKERQSLGGAGIGLSGSVALAATAVSLKSTNKVSADASMATLTAIKEQSSRRTFQSGTLLRLYLDDGTYSGADEYRLDDYPTGLLDSYIRKALKAGTRIDVMYPGESSYHRIHSYSELAKPEDAVGGSVTVEAKNDAKELLFAGGVNFGLAAGVGAAVVVLIAENDVRATAKTVEAGENVKIDASNTDNLLLLNINTGASATGAVEIGVTVSDLNSKVEALAAGGEIRAWNGAVDLTAENTTDMTDIGVSVAAAKTAAVSPIFLYTGFNGETNAILGGGKVYAGKGVTVKADSAKDDLDFYAVGAAFSGHTGISGAVTVVAAKDKTNALVTTGTEIQAGSLTVEASSDFKETAASATLVGAKKVALGVSGIVNIIKASTLAEMEGFAEVRDKATVKASATRDVLNVGANATFSGAVAAGMTVMVLTAGDKMDQDAANQLTYGNTKDGETKVFDSSDLVTHLKESKMDTSALGDLEYDLQGNGQKIDTSKLGHEDNNGKPKFDGSSGYGGSETGDEDDNDPNETDDLQKARTVGSTVYTDSPKDSVKARIGSYAVITAGEVDVEAEQETLADLFGATVGISGGLGGGISFTAAKLRSNVIASSLGDLDVTEGKVTVNAVSKSGEVKKNQNKDEQNRMKALVKELDNKFNPSARSIRAIGLAVGGGGKTGFSVTGSAVRLDNITQSTLSGSVKNALQVIVNSDASYSNVMAASVALAGAGADAIAASIAASVAEGTVNATIDEETAITGRGSHVYVTTNSTVNVDTVAATAAASGGGAVVAGLSLAVNNLTQNTTVERGAQIDIRTPDNVSNGSLHVNGVSNTTSRARLMGVNAGTVGVGMGVAIAKIKPQVHTTVGVEGDSDKVTTLNKLWKTEVTNTVTSSAETDLLTASIGGVAVAGNVLLVYNDTDALAKMGGVTGYLDGDLTINGNLSARGVSRATGATVGGVSVGATINHVDLNAVNTADLDVNDFSLDVNGKLTVIAGKKPDSGTNKTVWDTEAIANTIAASAGLVTIGVNTAVARNRTQNNAYITGSNLNVNSVEVGAYGNGRTEANITGLSAGAINVAVSVAHALNEATSRAYVDLNGAMNGDLDVFSDVRGATDAKLLTGVGALLGGVYTNVATARGRTASIAEAYIGAKPEWEDRSYTVKSTGRNDVNTKIENIEGLTSGAILSVGTMIGRAFSSDVYDAELNLTGETYKLRNVSVTTDYETHVNADTTPSAAGVKEGIVGVDVNKATAKNKSYAMARLRTQGIVGKTEAENRPTTLEVNGNVTVKTTGSADANAIVKPAAFQLDIAVGVGVNKAKADVSGTQAAILQLGMGGIEKAKLVDVQSIVNKTDAQATVGASGASDKSRVKVSIVSVDSNRATANASLNSTAAVMGGVTDQKTIDGMVTYGHWEEREFEYIDYDTAVQLEKYNSCGFKLDDTWYYGITGDYYELYDWHGNLLYTAFSTKDRDDKIEYFLSHGSNPVVTKTKKAWCAEGEDGNYYMRKTEKRNVWVEELKPGKVKVNIYNPAQNILKADSLNVYAGMAEGKKSSAKANSNGAKAFGIVTVGDLHASAHTGESISAMLEGVTATITGVATIKAASDTKAIATGYEPGGWSAAGGTRTDAKSGVGTQDEKETVTVVIGKDATLKAQKVTLSALNNGEAESSIDKGRQGSILATISKGSLPTESWYETLVTVGENAHVESTNGDVNLFTADSSDSTSKVKSSGFSVGVNYNSMKGENEIHQENNIDVGNSAKIIAHYGNVLIQAWQSTKATAETKYDGTGAVFASSTMKADNIVKRVVRANIGENAKITADGTQKDKSDGNVVVMAVSGIGNRGNEYLQKKYDNIFTNASVECKGFVGLSNAKAHADVESTSEIVVQGDAWIEAKRDVKLEALSTSFGWTAKYSNNLLSTESQSFMDEPGIVTKATADSKGGIPLPNAVAKTSLNFNTFINIHMRDENKADTPSKLTTGITAQEGQVTVKASNERLNIHNVAKAVGKGAVGVSNANAWVDATLSNAVWIDDAELSSYGDLRIIADNGGIAPVNISGENKSLEAMLRRATYNTSLMPYLYAYAKSELKGTGKAKAHARVTGNQINQVRSYDVDRVTLSSTAGNIIHLASEPMASVRTKVEANAKVPKIFGIKLGKTKTKEDLIWYYFNRCDFCGTGREYDVKPTDQMPIAQRYREAYERAILPINIIQQKVDNVGITGNGRTLMPGGTAEYVRALYPAGNINVTTGAKGSSTKAHYGLFDDQTVASIYVLAIQSILKKDVRLDSGNIASFKLWTNAETDHTTYLLPNATQLHMKGGKLEYVTEILQGDALGDGKTRYISVYTAVTSGAYARAIIPIGSTGTLNFLTGILTLPAHADYELYLHEVSSGWLVKQFESGMMRRAVAEQESLNAFALEGGELPEKEYAEALVPDGEQDGWLIYWLGNTPETAIDADEPLVYLLVNKATDEVDAYRTSVNMLANGDAPVDISLYIFRDAKADRTEEELYDVFFFDTPEGEMSLVKIITDTPGEEMQVPRSLQIKLRTFHIKNSGEAAFCLYDQVLILSREENGKASALNGFYTATFDSKSFISPYVRMTGLSDGNLVVIILKGQPVWAVWTGEDTAEGPDGTCYKLIDGVWYEVDKV